MSKYDFYRNPPKNREQIREYLTSWLEELDEKPTLEIEGETFIQEKGFRRAYCKHCVFRSLLTNEYVWWVFEPVFLQADDISSFPKKRYPTFESLIEGAVEEHYVAWRLTE